MESCEKVDETKLQKCLQEIAISANWEPLKSNIVSALKKSNNQINIKFDPSLDRAAITKVEVINDSFHPVIVLGKNSNTDELLITLNHELVHYLSTFDRLSVVTKSAKIKKCLTEYQLATLKDEAEAFKAELVFWNNAPLAFRDNLKKDFFHSKIFQKKLNYEEFYKLLDAGISQDKNFVLKKYIDWGDYPRCAKKII